MSKQGLRFHVDVYESWYTGAHVTHMHVSGSKAAELKAEHERVKIRPVRVGAQTELRLRRVEV